MFYPGNSNESIFEINWDYATYQEKNNFSELFTLSTSSTLKPTAVATELMKSETQALKDKGYSDTEGRMGRMLLATYVPDNGVPANWATANQFLMWKYAGTDVPDISGGIRANQDANFIIYRVAEVMLMKAQALVMKGSANWLEAVRLINRIRLRAGLENYNSIDTEAADAATQVQQLDELTLLEEILEQKELEFMGEAKRWYDVLWLGRVAGNKYKTEFVNAVIEGNQTTNQQWILSVLQDPWSWYMPIPQSDIDHNKALTQNPYYGGTK